MGGKRELLRQRQRESAGSEILEDVVVIIAAFLFYFFSFQVIYFDVDFFCTKELSNRENI